MQVYRKKWLIGRNKAIQKEIETLDAQADHIRIVHLMACYEFPWDLSRALEIALFRTFSSPNIAQLLDKTHQFAQHGQKRYDDTGILIGEFVQQGYDSEIGQRAIAQMNKIHSFYAIPNEDYLYVLSTFVLDPITWLSKYGWRQLSPREQDALFYFFKEVGHRMGLQQIPETLAALRTFAKQYEAQHCHFEPANQRVANATVAIVAGWYPRWIRFAIKPIVCAMIDEPMRQAFGYPPAQSWLSNTLRFVLNVRKNIVRYINLENSPALLAKAHIRSYPSKAYHIETLGPTHLVKKNNEAADITSNISKS